MLAHDVKEMVELIDAGTAEDFMDLLCDLLVIAWPEDTLDN